MPTVKESFSVSASPEQAFQVLADVESYPQFVPHITKAKILARTKGGWRVEFGMTIIQPIVYTVAMKFDPPYRITWKLVKGDYLKANEGSWKIAAQSAQKVDIAYEMSLELSVWIPAMVLKPIMASTFPAMLRAFQKRIAATAKRSG